MARANRKKLGLTTAPAEELATPLEAHEVRAEMYRQTFSSGPGAWVLSDMKVTFNDRSSFVPDSNATVFHEGQRDVYRMINALIDQALARGAFGATEQAEETN